MTRAFFSRNANETELTLLKKFLASYREGSGNLREVDGSSRADFRQIERCFAELLHGRTTENKAFYDFVVESNEGGGIAVRGASVKSKELKNLDAFSPKNQTLRAHMELSNSAAKDWELCQKSDLSEDLFRQMKYADEFGRAILERQMTERIMSQNSYVETQGANRYFVEKDCVYISLLYSPMVNGERRYLVSSFNAILPNPQAWVFKGKRLVGLDKGGDVIYEWYALSGGQFKYYPKVIDRTYGTNLFDLSNYKPALESLRAKVARMFGD
jgi:hypothetical protein